MRLHKKASVHENGGFSFSLCQESAAGRSREDGMLPGNFKPVIFHKNPAECFNLLQRGE
jgi:hypothetical protein